MKSTSKFLLSLAATACLSLSGCTEFFHPGFLTGTGGGGQTPDPGPTAEETPSDESFTPINCSDLSKEGLEIGVSAGKIPFDLTLRDQEGVDFKLRQFCNETVLIIAGGLHLSSSVKAWATAGDLLNNTFTDGKVKVVGLFITDPEGIPVGHADIRSFVDNLPGYRPNGVSLNDSSREVSRQYFPKEIGNTGFEGTMLLRPGFRVVKTGIAPADFKTEIQSVLDSIK